MTLGQFRNATKDLPDDMPVFCQPGEGQFIFDVRSVWNFGTRLKLSGQGYATPLDSMLYTTGKDGTQPNFPSCDGLSISDEIFQ